MDLKSVAMAEEVLSSAKIDMVVQFPPLFFFVIMGAAATQAASGAIQD